MVSVGIVSLDRLDKVARDTIMDLLYKKRLTRMIQEGNLVLFAAKKDDRYVGRVSLWLAPIDEIMPREKYPGVPFVNALEVNKNYRRQGIATRLLDVLEDETRKRGQNKIALGVEPDNDAATMLYLGRGYKMTGDVYESCWDESDENGNVKQFCVEVRLITYMIATEQKNSDNLRLVAPHIERDPPLGMMWMNGAIGHETQRLMGIPSQEIHDHDLAEEQRLTQYFIDTDEELVWMIQYEQKIVGALEIGFKTPKEEHGPSISIMIGDPNARGKGIGKKVMNHVIEYLQQSGYKELHARYILGNVASEAMQLGLGFIKSGDIYTDNDGIVWQNLVKKVDS